MATGLLDEMLAAPSPYVQWQRPELQHERREQVKSFPTRHLALSGQNRQYGVRCGFVDFIFKACSDYHGCFAPEKTRIFTVAIAIDMKTT